MNKLKPGNAMAACCVVFISALLCGCGGGGATSSPPPPPPADTPADWLKANAHEFSSTNPDATDFSDLAAFGDAIGDARRSRAILAGAPLHHCQCNADCRHRTEHGRTACREVEKPPRIFAGIRFLHAQIPADVAWLETMRQYTDDALGRCAGASHSGPPLTRFIARSIPSEPGKGSATGKYACRTVIFCNVLCAFLAAAAFPKIRIRTWP